MKLAVSFSLLTLAFIARPAAACDPIPSCGDEFCRSAAAIVEGTVGNIGGTPDVPTITLDVTAVFGSGVPTGPVTLPATPGAVFPDEVGTVVILSLQRDAADQLVIEEQLRRQSDDFIACFGDDRPTAEVAEILIAPTCDATLAPIHPDRPPCDDGPPGCSAGGGAGLLVGLGALIGARRSRQAPR